MRKKIIFSLFFIACLLFFSPKPAYAFSFGGFISSVFSAVSTAVNVGVNAVVGTVELGIGYALDGIGIDNNLVESGNCRFMNMTSAPISAGEGCGGNDEKNKHHESDPRNPSGDSSSSCDYHECGVCEQPCRDKPAMTNVVWYIGSDCEPHGYPCNEPAPTPTPTPTPDPAPTLAPDYRCIPPDSRANNSTCCDGNGEGCTEGLTADVHIKNFDGNASCSGKCQFKCLREDARIAHNCAPPVRGVCGNAQGEMYCQKPTSTSEIKLCNSGDPIGIKSVGSYWEWTCQGRNGGDNSGTCKALKSCAYREVVPN